MRLPHLIGKYNPTLQMLESRNPASVIEREPDHVQPEYDNPGPGLDYVPIDATEQETTNPAKEVSRDVEPEVLEDVNTGNQNFSCEADPDDVSKQQLEADPADEVSCEPQVVDLGKLASSTNGIVTISMGADHGH